MAKKKIFMIAPNFYGIDKSVKSVFESLGFEVFLKNTRNRLEPAESLSIKITKAIPIATGALNPFIKSFLDKDNAEYLSLIREAKPDIFFIIKGETIYPETLSCIKNEMKIPCFIYQWDCPFYSYADRPVDTYRKKNFADGMHLYDHIFSHDPYYVDQIKTMGAKSVSYLPLATDPNLYRDIEVSGEERRGYDFDVCFVGSPFPNRIDILNSLREFKLGVFGDGWKMWHALHLKKTPDYYKGKAAGEKALKLYASSKIILNIHGPEAKYGVNTRTFDISACGAFELADYRPEMDKLFKPGEEIVYYRDADELKRLVRFYLENPEKRRAIIEKGKSRVLSSHTWSHRMREVVEHFPSHDSSRK